MKQRRTTCFVICAASALLIGWSELARADDYVDCQGVKGWNKRSAYHRGDIATSNDPDFNAATPVLGKYQCDADSCDETYAGGKVMDPGHSSKWKRLAYCSQDNPSDIRPRRDKKPSKDSARDAPKDTANDAPKDDAKDASPRVKPGGGSPREKATEVVFAKHNDEIKKYCGNASVAFKVDWSAYEALDWETLAKTQCDRTDGNKLRDVVLYGDRNPADMCGGAATNNASYVTKPFLTVCRDHAELRANAAKITTIVISPMHFKFQDDKEAIAYARKTNDYTVLKKANKKEDDDSGYRRDYRKLSVSGTTLVVKVPITAIRGDEDEMLAQLLKLLDR
jgi:hypothetical protein